MHRSERSIAQCIVRHLEAEGWWALKFHGSVFQPAGIPDLLAIKNGKVLFLEVKRDGGIVSKIQRAMLARLHAAGATTAVVRSVDDVLGVLSMMDEGQMEDA